MHAEKNMKNYDMLCKTAANSCSIETFHLLNEANQPIKISHSYIF